MCGIVGMLDLDGGDGPDRELLERMCDAIRHRGPDDDGYYVDGPVALGMRRLAIIDVAAGKQPIANEDGTVWIVYNGEIYNHLDLREELLRKGHVFRTHSDTETIVHLYEEEGLDCVQRLRGMFAFLIWDQRLQRLFGARDRLGIKPLFWAQRGERLYFGSEMKSLLLSPAIERDIDWNGFDAYFAYNYIPAPLTIYRAIRKLPPAHAFVVEGGEMKVHRYWDVSFADPLRGSVDEIRQGFLEVMAEAVRIRLMSEVPLGSFLSGGVDSGVVVALMSRAASAPVNTFTIGFGGEVGSFLDERPFAREIAARYGCRHLEIDVAPHIEEALDACVGAFDEPFADDGIIPTYHICKEARRHVTVVLTGLGGDEDFAGYDRYLGLWFSRYYDGVPGFLKNRIIRPLIMSLREDGGGHNRADHAKRFVRGGELSPARRYQSYIQALDAKQRRALYTPAVAEKVDFDYVDHLGREHFERLDDGGMLDRALYQDLNMYLPEDILALSDRVGMHHSLELRVPFVDHKVVEYCARIPARLKIKGRDKKHLLKAVARDLLPAGVIDHRKQGFCAPMAVWLRGDLRRALESGLSPEVLARDGLFRPAAVGALVDDHLRLRRSNEKALFSLLVFRKWLERQPGVGHGG